MQTLPATIAATILPFTELFRKSLHQRVCLALCGALLAPAQRTVAAVLRVVGRDQHKDFQQYHRLLNRVQWSARKAAQLLLRMLLEHLMPGKRVRLIVDDTIERRNAKKILQQGVYRDPVRSSHSHFVKTTGLRWLSFQLLVDLPFCKRPWALPVLTILAPSQRYCCRNRLRYKKLTDWARQGLMQLQRWMPQRQITVVADSSFAAIELLQALAPHMRIITRLRLDAQLYAKAPKPTGKPGRPRSRGKKLPSLKTPSIDPTQHWKSLELTRWYQSDNRPVEILSGTALWSVRSHRLPIRWVLVRDLLGHFPLQAFLSTDPQQTPQQILETYVERWQCEVTFREVREHLGFGTQRQWNPLAIARTTPILMALYSIATLIAYHLFLTEQITPRSTAWYPQKTVCCFSDAITAVRSLLWRHRLFSTSAVSTPTSRISTDHLNLLIQLLAYGS